MRIGLGYDIHPLKTGRKLILGGVTIHYNKGLYGHSDADVLIHAIIDALLGAATLPDIGQQFPSDDLNYKDISSLVLLDKVNKLVKEKGYTICNIDSVIIAEKPSISPYIPLICTTISANLNIAISQINVKATTNEKLGYLGHGKGIAAYAVALLE